MLQLNADTYEADGVLAQIRKDNHYDFEDQVTCSREKLPNYEATVTAHFLLLTLFSQ
jgi:1,2-dihydroxy-3-keto-5-methylthiopentene dioxygenase